MGAPEMGKGSLQPLEEILRLQVKLGTREDPKMISEVVEAGERSGPLPPRFTRKKKKKNSI